MFNENEKHLKCKDCIYYSGVQCHGHGLFFGTCELLDHVYKLIENINYHDNIIDSIVYPCYDDDICHLIDKGGDK